MNYHVIVYGCQMNISDSERVSAVLGGMGYKNTPKINEADLIAVVMCSVRQSAVDRVHGLIQKLRRLKRPEGCPNKKLKTVLTGCILKKDRKIFSEKFDYVLDIKDIKKLPEALGHNGVKFRGREISRQNNYLDIAPKYSSKFSANVPIMTGCNNFCSYCVVPYAREREVSRPAKKIIREIKNLVKTGYKEVWLLGQNVNSYKNGKTNFPKLLEMINDIPGDFWIRFTSSHPKDFSDRLIGAMANYKKVTPYLNLPVQSGDNSVLKSMNRRYTVESYKNKIKKLRKKIPGIAISTDIIVGFPGETKKQFENTVKLFKDIKYDMAYINKYSARAGTAAARLKDDVSIAEKKKREKILTEVLKQTALEKNKKLIGKKTIVLFNENRGSDYFGKNHHYKTIKVKSDKNILGKLIKVKIVKAMPFVLKGEITGPKKTDGLIVILGPTASGKTDLSIKLAKKFKGEVISADSRQVYKGMDIGTGKITKKEMRGIPHHLLDVANPKKIFTVAQYQKLALTAIKKIQKKNKVPILVGGTGFYIQSVVDGIVVPEVKPDWKLRKKLERRPVLELFQMLTELDPARAKNIDQNNPRRVIRALEIILKTGKPVPALEGQTFQCSVLEIGVRKSHDELKKNINERLLERLKGGTMVSEVKKLRKSGLSWKRLEEFGLEYRLVAQYLQNKITYQEMADGIQKESEHYAKRQMTWFKRDKRIKWIKNYREAENLVKKFLARKDYTALDKEAS